MTVIEQAICRKGAWVDNRYDHRRTDYAAENVKVHARLQNAAGDEGPPGLRVPSAAESAPSARIQGPVAPDPTPGHRGTALERSRFPSSETQP